MGREDEGSAARRLPAATDEVEVEGRLVISVANEVEGVLHQEPPGVDMAAMRGESEEQEVRVYCLGVTEVASREVLKHWLLS